MKKIFLLLLLMAAPCIFEGQAQAQVVVIANTNVKSDSISKKELREIFNGESSNLKGGSQVAPVLLQQCATHEAFLATFMGENDLSLRRAWRGLVFAGQASMPKFFDSEAALVDYVAHSAGAIGYVGKDTPHPGVKVLAVQ